MIVLNVSVEWDGVSADANIKKRKSDNDNSYAAPVSAPYGSPVPSSDGPVAPAEDPLDHVVVCLGILFPDQRTRTCSEASQLIFNSAQLATASSMRNSELPRSGWEFSTNNNIQKSSRRRRTWH